MKNKEKLKELFVDLFSIEDNVAVQDININKISSWDSLNHLSLIVSIEDKFEIDISPDDFPNLYSDFNTILDLFVVLFKSFELSMGAIERAVKVLITIVIDKAIAISLKSVPLIPLINNKGAKVAKIIMLVDKIAKITFLDPLAAAASGVSPCSTL